MSKIGPFEEAIPPATLKQVASVVPHLEVRDIRLIGLSANLKAVPPTKTQTAVDLGHKTDMERAHDGAVLLVRVHFTLRAADSENKTEFVALKAGFQLIYEIRDSTGVTEDQLTAFADVNAVHTAWPYFRELVHSMSGRMGIPAMTVPLLKIGVSKRAPEPDKTSPPESEAASAARPKPRAKRAR